MGIKGSNHIVLQVEIMGIGNAIRMILGVRI